MDSVLIMGYAVIAAVGLVLVGGAAAVAWAVVQVVRRGYRRITRRHLYVPVVGKVSRSFVDLGVLRVSYEFDGREVRTRVAAPGRRGRRARQAGAAGPAGGGREADDRPGAPGGRGAG